MYQYAEIDDYTILYDDTRMDLMGIEYRIGLLPEMEFTVYEGQPIDQPIHVAGQCLRGVDIIAVALRKNTFSVIYGKGDIIRMTSPDPSKFGIMALTLETQMLGKEGMFKLLNSMA